MSERDLAALFERVHQRILKTSPVPEIHVAFYRFANLNHTIRLRGGKIYVRLSDLCRDAPIEVLEALAYILLGKLYKRKLNETSVKLYKAYTLQDELKERVRAVRLARARKAPAMAIGKVYNLREMFDGLNQQYFGGRLELDHIGWTRGRAIKRLGFYDEVQNRIIISKSLDQPSVPRFFLEYIVYHEMLHMVHPEEVRNGRNYIHHERFQNDEKQFPFYRQAQNYLKRIDRKLRDRI